MTDRGAYGCGAYGWGAEALAHRVPLPSCLEVDLVVGEGLPYSSWCDWPALHRSDSCPGAAEGRRIVGEAAVP